jgi:hypothetical protein
MDPGPRRSWPVRRCPELSGQAPGRRGNVPRRTRSGRPENSGTGPGYSSAASGSSRGGRRPRRNRPRCTGPGTCTCRSPGRAVGVVPRYRPTGTEAQVVVILNHRGNPVTGPICPQINLDSLFWMPRYYLRLHNLNSENMSLSWEREYRIGMARAGVYRSIRANMERTRPSIGLDQSGVCR